MLTKSGKYDKTHLEEVRRVWGTCSFSPEGRRKRDGDRVCGRDPLLSRSESDRRGSEPRRVRVRSSGRMQAPKAAAICAVHGPSPAACKCGTGSGRREEGGGSREERGGSVGEEGVGRRGEERKRAGRRGGGPGGEEAGREERRRAGRSGLTRCRRAALSRPSCRGARDPLPSQSRRCFRVGHGAASESVTVPQHRPVSLRAESSSGDHVRAAFLLSVGPRWRSIAALFARTCRGEDGARGCGSGAGGGWGGGGSGAGVASGE